MARPKKDAPVDLGEPHELTVGVIERLACPPGKSQAFLRDGKGNGLRIRVTAGGAKSFVFEAKLRGHTIRRTIGDVRGLTIDEARKEARKLQATLGSRRYAPIRIRSARRISRRCCLPERAKARSPACVGPTSNSALALASRSVTRSTASGSFPAHLTWPRCSPPCRATANGCSGVVGQGSRRTPGRPKAGIPGRTDESTFNSFM